MLPRKVEATEARLDGLALPEGGGWLRAAREDALARVRAVGLPDRRDEYWRYTDPAPFNAAAPGANGAAGEDVFGGVDALVVRVTADGASWDGALPDGLEITTLTEAGAADIHWARDLYGVLEAAGSRPVSRPHAMMNTAFATGGVVIRATAEVKRPVHLRYEGAGDAVLHHVVKVEADAALVLLETGFAGARHATVAEVDVAANGSFHHVRVQGRGDDRHAHTHLFGRLGEGAAFRSFTLSQNGTVMRNEAVLDLAGDDALAHVGGAAIGEGKFHHDDTVFVTHGALRGESRQVFKKVLRSGATGVFQGKILVKEGAQKTDGYQISQSLLLDDDAQFLAKPELEIYADDVACSHGSTTGAIDETALFYLRSRGVPEKEATDLLVLSFLAEAVEEIEEEDLRERITETLAEWLRG
ncbi:SufD family Fe-S cluster assembly protein [Jannaschia sp. W003]|uniref:SufB/SufD family protein n=1 Tax=Jannaschia sp. W003 TaxID=2867012 RepID=UPI0038FC8504